MKRHLLFVFSVFLTFNALSQKANIILEKGKVFYKNKDYTRAIERFSSCIEKEKNSEAYKWRGNSYFSLKNYSKALEDYNCAISQSPNPTADNFLCRGNAKLMLSDYYGALEDYNKSLELANNGVSKDFNKFFELANNGVTYYERGQAYYHLQRYNEALSDFNKAIDLKVDESIIAIWKMYTYWSLGGQYANVITEATKVIGANPSEYAYFYRGFSCANLNKTDEGLKDALTLTEKYPNLDLGNYLNGYIYLSQRKYDLAIRYFEDALKINPSNSSVNYYLSRTYYYKNDFEKALSFINKAISTDSTSGNYLFKGRIYYYGFQNIAEANKCFEKVLELEKNRTNTAVTYALLFLGREEEAITMQKQIIRENNDATNYLTLACFYSILDREPEAIENIEKAFEIGYSNQNELLGLTDLNNIKFKKSYRELLAKHGIPYDIDNKTLIQVYVKSAVNRWQKRGKFEKSGDYLSRVNETNRKKYIESATNEAIQFVGRLRVEPNILRSEYNPDIESFKLFFAGDQSIMVKVPVAEAQSFDANISRMEISPVFALSKEGDFLIDQVKIKNPLLDKTYQGSANLSVSFTSAQLSLDFAPVQTYIDKYKVKEVPLANIISENKKEPDVDSNIPRTTKIKDKTFALVIGNEDYSSYQPDLNSEVNVDYAANDAKVFKEYLNKTLGLPNENIFLYINATAGQINQAINKMEKLAKSYYGEAELIFFFAGHGLPDENTHESYIMPVDISGSTIQYAVKLGDLYRQLSANPAKRILVFLDACFSGGARNEGLVTLRGVKIKPKEEAVSENMVVFASSSGTQSSMGFDQEQHGIFTYFLLKRLKETRGDISLDEMGKYLETEVNRKSVLLKNREQKPYMIFSPAASTTLLSKKISD
jgi:tetratricopeptide (TPR) repeat protein